HGAIAGVDTERFAPNPEHRRRFREQLGLAEGAILVLFVGRLKQDKGVLDLVAAWKSLAPALPMLHVALVGPDEDGLDRQLRAAAGPELSSRLHRDGFTAEPEAWIRAADILSLP